MSRERVIFDAGIGYAIIKAHACNLTPSSSQRQGKVGCRYPSTEEIDQEQSGDQTASKEFRRHHSSSP